MILLSEFKNDFGLLLSNFSTERLYFGSVNPQLIQRYDPRVDTEAQSTHQLIETKENDKVNRKMM